MLKAARQKLLQEVINQPSQSSSDPVDQFHLLRQDRQWWKPPERFHPSQIQMIGIFAVSRQDILKSGKMPFEASKSGGGTAECVNKWAGDRLGGFRV
jgi:hypothetical protein